jgi:hypothetical protein
MVGAIGLFEADYSLLGRPVQRQVDMRGEFQIGQFSTLGDRLDDFRRQKRKPDEAGNVAIGYTLLIRCGGVESERTRTIPENEGILRTHFVIRVDRILEIARSKAREPRFRRHPACDRFGESQRAEAQTARFRQRRRHATEY